MGHLFRSYLGAGRPVHKRKITIKTGVSMWGLHRDLYKAILIVRDIMWTVGGVRTVITSAMNGEHSKNSLHDDGFAADVRSKELATDALKQQIRTTISNRLHVELDGSWDVLLESLGGNNEHFHIEKNATAQERYAHVDKVYTSGGT